VTRCKRAELLRVPASATQVETCTQPQALQARFAEVTGGAFVVDTLEPEAAWRTVSDGRGGSVMCIRVRDLAQSVRSGMRDEKHGKTAKLVRRARVTPCCVLLCPDRTPDRALQTL
jgi:hypothetical protein